MVTVEENTGVLQDEKAFDLTTTPQVGSEAGGVLPSQVTQPAKPARQRLQEAEDDLPEGRAQRLWRRMGWEKKKIRVAENFFKLWENLCLPDVSFLPSSSRGRKI